MPEDFPRVAIPVGHETTELIDKLYDENQIYIRGALDQLNKSREIKKLATETGPPADLMNTIRWADLNAKGIRGRKLDEIVERVETVEIDPNAYQERLREIEEMCEKNGIPYPKDDDDTT